MSKYYRILPLALMSLAGLLLFALEQKISGYFAILAALVLAYNLKPVMARELSLVAFGMFIVSLVPISTDISYTHMTIMGLALTAAVAGPTLISRYVFKNPIITFPFKFQEPWDKFKKLYLLLVFVVGVTILPLYMIGTGMYLNWPAASSIDSVIRLFIGTNALGIWDELFFICIVFVIFRRHATFWQANILQAVIFTSFLYELGFKGIGPLFIYVFALTQGYLFNRTHSLFYLLCVHLLFDFILFLVLLYSHNPNFINQGF